MTVEQAQQIFNATRVLSYRVFFFTIYSMGLRLGEGLRLQVGDIDADRMRMHVRNAKGNRDRLVPLPANTLDVLRLDPPFYPVIIQNVELHENQHTSEGGLLRHRQTERGGNR